MYHGNCTFYSSNPGKITKTNGEWGLEIEAVAVFDSGCDAYESEFLSVTPTLPVQSKEKADHIIH